MSYLLLPHPAVVRLLDEGVDGLLGVLLECSQVHRLLVRHELPQPVRRNDLDQNSRRAHQSNEGQCLGGAVSLGFVSVKIEGMAGARVKGVGLGTYNEVVLGGVHLSLEDLGFGRDACRVRDRISQRPGAM